MSAAAALPVLLLPGLLCDGALWQHQIDYLTGARECLVGDTTGQAGQDSIAAIATAILAAAPDRFALAALSMGGYVALDIMRRAPERVERLCLCDTSARPDTPEQQQKRRLLIALSQKGQFKGVTPRLLPMLIHPDRMQDASLTGVVTDMAARVGREAFARQQTAILKRIDSRPFLAHIRCPTLVIGGAEDQLTPPAVMQELATGIPGATHHIIPDCGHLAPLERPERVNALISEWLTA